jgi:outer membrane protein assembly factor BamD
MKKFALLALFAALFLTACSKPYVQDPYKKYTQYSAVELYNRAQVAMKKHNYDTAVKQYQALDGLYPFSKYAKRGRVDVIYAYYKNGDQTSTVVAAERYLHLQPRSRYADYAYYMRGVASFSKGQSWLQKKFNVSPADRDPERLLQAYQSFRTVVNRYPNSQYRQDSELRMSYLRNLIAEHYMRVAKYYYSVDAYVAAADRASDVVSHFQGAKQVPAALAMLYQSYKRLHLPGRAQQSYDILKANYPTSRAFKAL